MRAALLALCACGRIGFDARPSLGDAGDANDGMRDAGTCTPFDHTLAIDVVNVAGLAWIGDGYVVYGDNGLAFLSEDGTLGSFQQVPNLFIGPIAGATQIAWSGSELVVVFVDVPGNVNVQRYDATLTAIGSATLIAGGSGSIPYVTWTGNGYAVTWVDMSSVVHLIELDTSAAVIAQQTLSGSMSASKVGGLVATPTHYLIGVFEGTASPTQTNLFVAPRPLSGPMVEVATALGTSYSDFLQLAPVPGGVVAVHSRGNGNDTMVQRLDNSGAASSISQALAPYMGAAQIVDVGVSIGSSVRIFGVGFGGNPMALVSQDYDSATQTLSAPSAFGQVTASSLRLPAAASAPGRMLLVLSYFNGGASAMLELVQQCL